MIPMFHLLCVAANVFRGPLLCIDSRQDTFGSVCAAYPTSTDLQPAQKFLLKLHLFT